MIEIATNGKRGRRNIIDPIYKGKEDRSNIERGIWRKKVRVEHSCWWGFEFELYTKSVGTRESPHYFYWVAVWLGMYFRSPVLVILWIMNWGGEILNNMCFKVFCLSSYCPLNLPCPSHSVPVRHPFLFVRCLSLTHTLFSYIYCILPYKL